MKQYLLFILLVGLVGCSNNEIVEIEQSNSYEWQKYMNGEEFAKLQEGMTYMDVVKIAGGAGELQLDDKKNNKQMYIWLDERLLTQAYEITFEDDQLVSKNIVERRGHSTRE